MKKLLRACYASLVLFCLGSCTKSCKPSEHNDVLRIGTNATYVPYESVNQKGELEGFDIDVGYALGKALNKKVVFKEFDFDALILALKKDQIDIAISALSITASRQKEIAMVPYQGEPITKVSFLFWGQAPNLVSFQELQKLTQDKKLPVNVQAGHFLEDFLKEVGVDTKAMPGPPEQIIDIKYAKSLAAAVDPPNGATLSSIHQEIHAVSIDLPQDKWDLGYGIGIKKSSSELIAQIKQAVATLKEDGSIKALENKWLKGNRE